MEPHVTTAVWDPDDHLTLYETTQHLFGTRDLVAIVLGLPPEKITVVSHFLGGGFGGKAYVWPHTLLAALAARVLNRPVRLQLTRAQMYSMVGHQAATIQTIALGADKNGKLTGIRHESISPTPIFDNYIEYAAMASRHLWAATDGISTNHKVVHVNRNTPTAMRSPHEGLGHFALESAMDELAYATATDPVALRLLNEWHYTPKHGSWVDMAESELSVLSVQCLDRRIPDRQTLIEEVAAWQKDRNKNHTKADWHFTTVDARIKLKRLYPAI